MACIIPTYIAQLSKDERVRNKLNNFHNEIFNKLTDSKLFRKWNDYYFLPNSTSPEYVKAKNLITQVNNDYSVPVVSTSFTRANAKEFVFVNVKNLLPEASQPDATQGELFQTENIIPSIATPAIVKKMKEWLNRANIKVEQLDTKRYGGINAVANLLNQTIQIAEGKENVAITEETMHFLVEMLKQGKPAIYNQMMNRISRYDTYASVKSLYGGLPQYRNQDGSLNIIKLKEEAVGKVLAEYYLNNEQPGDSTGDLLVQTKSWLDAIIQWIKDLLRKNTNPFQEALEQMDAVVNTNITQENPLREQLLDAVRNADIKGFTAEIYKQWVDEPINHDELIRSIVDQVTSSDSERQGAINTFGQEVVDAALQFANQREMFQLAEDPASQLFKKFDDKIIQYNLKKKEDLADPDDENTNSYYTIDIDGKTIKTDRTTEWAKRRNLSNTGGKDYFKDATPAQKKQWAKKALTGTKGHQDLENIVNQAINEDGSLKSIEDVSLKMKNVTILPVYNSLVEYMIGTPASPGFLYTNFPPGTKFRTEQQIFNEKAKAKVNQEELIGRAGTMDLVAVEPSGKVRVYDYKFMGFSLERNPDQPRNKRAQHALQLGDYKNTLKQAYGVNEFEAFTIPIHAQYDNVEDEDGETFPVLTSITIGNKNFREEERTYLLPVIPDSQSSGSPRVDSLVKQLKARYNKLYERRVTEDTYDIRNQQLDRLSASIRNLQVALNFEPLAREAKDFQAIVDDIIKKYKEAPPSSLEERKKATTELLDIINTTDYYSSVDEVFTATYGRENLSEKSQKVLDELRNSSSVAKEQKDQVLEIINRIAVQLANENGFDNFLSAEKEVKGQINSLLEASSLPNKSIRLFSKLYTEAHSSMQIELNQLNNKYGDLYLAASKESDSPFSKIVDESEWQLRDRYSPEFFSKLKTAKEKKDKKTILNSIDRERYNSLVKQEIEKRSKIIDGTTYYSDEDRNNRAKSAEKNKLRKNLEIGRSDFSGYDDPTFNWILSQVDKRAEHPSDSYKELSEKFPATKALYDYYFDLNNSLKELGYLKQKDSRLFFAFITASNLQRISQSSNTFSTLRSVFSDEFQVQIEEEHQYEQRDVETGETKKSIPALFTRTNKSKEDLSRDLLRIGTTLNRSYLEFKLAKELEDEFLLLHKVEQNKGHLETDKSGDVIFEGDKPAIFAGNKTNADLLEKNINDAIYAISQDSDTILDTAVTRLTKGTEEEKETTRTSVKKTILWANALTQQLAVGLKALVAIPNYVGAHIQAVINAGGYFKGREYEINHAKIAASQLSTEDKALMDLIIPLNEDIVKEKRRKIARKESFQKWAGTWTFNDVMMSSNQFPDKWHQLTNALTWMDNTMIVDGQMVNIRQHLKKQYLTRYALPAEQRKMMEKEFEAKVTELKNTQSIRKIAKFNEQGEITIPGFSIENSNIGAYRNRILEYGRYITGQMSRENKADYRRNIIGASFMMFKNWIPKQVSLRALDIHKNPLLDEWEYGRTRLFFKTWQHLGLTKILKIRHLTNATPEGLEIMREMLQEKKEAYYKKTGQQLEISEEEFFDMVRKELKSEYKELALLVGLAALVIAAKLGAPDDDEDPRKLNQYKTLLKAVNKISDELYFYWNPLSAESITRGTVLPSLGILSKVTNIITHTGTELLGPDWKNSDLFSDEIREKNKTIKYWMNLVPVANQFQTELLPIIDPELAKNLGIKVSAEARAFR